MYEIAKWRSNCCAAEPDTALELLAGGRYWRQELDVDLALAGTLNIDGLVISRGVAIARSGTVDWIDPFIGARLHYIPAPGEEIIVRGDVGGFGAGSQFTWQAMATYNWFLYPARAADARRLPRLARAVGRLREGQRHQPLRVRRAAAGPGGRRHRPLLARAPLAQLRRPGASWPVRATYSV